jgi:hypothetical protein
MLPLVKSAVSRGRVLEIERSRRRRPASTAFRQPSQNGLPLPQASGKRL